MALYVNTNVSSLNANRNLANSTTALDVSYKRLASGLRINSAKDDAAGLQISNRLTSQINGLNQGNRNAQDGISYSQTAEGAMDEMTSMYYGGTHILDGSITTQTLFQVGANANETISIDLRSGFTLAQTQAVVAADPNLTTDETAALATITATGFDVSTQANSQSTLMLVDKFVAVIDAKRAELGAVQNRLESTIRNQTNVSENVSDARSRIRDADFATETAAMTSQANQRPQIALSLLQS